MDLAIGDDLWGDDQKSFLASCREPLALKLDGAPMAVNRSFGDAGFVSGWSGAEDTGIWSIGTSSHLLLVAKRSLQDHLLVIAGGPFIPFGMTNEISIWIGGNRVFLALLGQADLFCALRFPFPAVNAGAVIDIELRLTSVVSPQSLGIGPDPRELGFFVQSIGVHSADADIALLYPHATFPGVVPDAQGLFPPLEVAAVTDWQHPYPEIVHEAISPEALDDRADDTEVRAPASLWGESPLSMADNAFGHGLIKGWSDPEEEGVWSIGQSSLLSLLAEEDLNDHDLVIVGKPFLPPLESNQISAWLDGQEVCTAVLERPGEITTFHVPLPEMSKGDVVTVELRLASSFSPSSLGLSTDDRQLGFFVHTICAQRVEDGAPDVETRAPAPLWSDRPVSTASGASGDTGLIAGWSYPEEEGVWSIGQSSLLSLLAEEDLNDHDLVIVGKPFLPPLESNQISAWLDGQEVCTAVLERPGEITTFHVPLPEMSKGDVVTVELRLASSFSPSSLGLSTDDRQLGFFVHTICAQRVEDGAPDVETQPRASH
ncbi:hypothetical protein [Sphingobium naphthae]|uniref:hypothetical protein n=1 Tax=Sphingobium naphthae TaxID=1886786 RepID=UPI0037499E2D